jgi:toxin-antitoxin system PIN domain toxin
MLMPDINILVYAHREQERWHEAHAAWLRSLVDGPEPFSLSVLVATGFLRIVTDQRIYREPTPLGIALAFIEELTAHPRCRIATPGAGHLDDVVRLCRDAGATGGDVSDAQHAALAISEGATWVTRDAGFARYAPHGLRWQHLLLE